MSLLFLLTITPNQALVVSHQVKLQICLYLEEELYVVGQEIYVLPIGGQEELHMRVLHNSLIQRLKAYLFVFGPVYESAISFPKMKQFHSDL